MIVVLLLLFLNGFLAGAGNQDIQYNERGQEREFAGNGNEAGNGNKARNGNLNRDLIKLFYQCGQMNIQHCLPNHRSITLNR